MLRTQQQGWRDQSSTQRLVSKERHYAILQEAAGLVVEDRRADMRVCRGASPDDLEVATDIMADLQHQQEVESQMLLALHSKVNSSHSPFSRHFTLNFALRMRYDLFVHFLANSPFHG